MRLPTGITVVVSLLCAAGLVAAAGDDPTVGELSGQATYLSGGKGEPKPLAKGDTLAKGDEVTLGDGAKMKVTLPEGAYVEVVGPARFRLLVVSEFAWTVSLESGTIEHLVAIDSFVGVSTPAEVYVAVQRTGDVTVSVESTDAADTITVTLNDGNAKVVQRSNGGEASDLVQGEPFVLRSEKAKAETEAEEPAPRTLPRTPDKPVVGATIRIGDHLVRVVPKDAFTIAPTPGGGWIMTCKVPEGEFGQITLDNDVNFFLSRGEFMEFNSQGVVVGHTGIVHVYAALDIRGIYDEAVANPSDASFVGNTSE